MRSTGGHDDRNAAFRQIDGRVAGQNAGSVVRQDAGGIGAQNLGGFGAQNVGVFGQGGGFLTQLFASRVWTLPVTTIAFAGFLRHDITNLFSKCQYALHLMYTTAFYRLFRHYIGQSVSFSLFF